MPIVMRLLSVYVMLTGAAVAVHFVAVPWYHPGGGEPYPIWTALDWLMGVASPSRSSRCSPPNDASRRTTRPSANTCPSTSSSTRR